jgi:ubiquinone biosynthesis protein
MHTGSTDRNWQKPLEQVRHPGPIGVRRSGTAWLNLSRLLCLVTVLLKHAVSHLAHTAARRWKPLRRCFPALIPGPERLRRTIEDLGGTYIKFGQMLALQPDIISLEYCDALFDLLDRVAPFPFAEVERIFVEEFGKRPDELFDSFDREPLATASIGQVHVAWLDGRKVAVKIQRPSVDKDFGDDIRLMNGAIWLIRTLRLGAFRWMIEPMSEFIGWTREELDYRCEARYLRQLGKNARDNPNEKVPELFDGFTTRRTLVTEFLEGCTVLGYLRALARGDTRVIQNLEANGFDSHIVASRIIDNFLGDAFRHGLFHADLHPANLMILPDNRVGYIDFGITGTISSYARQNLVALTLAYTRGDLEEMCASFFRVSTIDSNSDVARFRRGIVRESAEWYGRGGDDRRLRKNFTRVMLDMSRLSLQCGVRPAREVVKYIRSAIAIDGLITRFAPTFDLGAHLATVCERYLKWRLRSSIFNFDNLLSSVMPLGRLLWDGGPRALEALDRVTAAGFDLSRPGGGRRHAAVFRGRVQYAAAFLFTVCFGAYLSLGKIPPEKIQFGMNLFTSEVVLASAAALALVDSVRKLPKENNGA